ncbi:cbb3-type cytochrome oxidase subunit 3 [Noviherbaspirillum saxi]|uniref:CcoQ/FixQ family Cbb3-type cytochrome c oxidase assembly chaperone n=1 Tax=Noviherbaspirillum saxi TaxID=2320863 RepID=A0A3A3FLD7_9BURK|nr:cbb3-type cytochrome c oxidase subunit 3 [Noviherbaspirillum saxi]RJF96117.1 CcoQ/FixQ family Cbb3-type cytochrome c oxidase assembly chaperone [Noviherbaspirillum saxi]
MTIEQFLFDARSLVTVLSFLSFVGIVWWAYSARRGDDFAVAANLPFADETGGKTSERSAEDKHV